MRMARRAGHPALIFAGRAQRRVSLPRILTPDNMLKILVRTAGWIDALNERAGRVVAWLVLAAVLVSAGNASVRYAFNLSSNAWLEIQWYLFSAIFLLGAGYALRRNAHVRVDVLAGRLSPRGQAWIDIFGGLVFLLPMALMIGYLSWPVFWQSFIGSEVSSDAGGLIRWPVKLLIPAGFALLSLQACAEIIKRVAFLMGAGPDPRGATQERR
jgi:TRAP-type mannitol/chloroaromatic compound transport system permease small subunit